MNIDVEAAEHPPALPPHPSGHVVVKMVMIAALAAVAAVGAVFGVQRVLRSSESPSTAAMPGMEMGQGAPPPSGASSSAVFISPARQQLIGVRTGVVERQQAGGTTRTVGVLAYDETRVTHVHVKVAGWVEQLFIDYVGKPVRRGQPLFSVYSPDLVTAESDYLVALRSRQQLGDLPEARSTSDALVRASRERLRRWDVSDAEIAALEAAGKASKTVTLFAPFDGIVLERNTFAGQYVTPDMNTFKIGDLSTVWAIGQAFEYEAMYIHVGETVDVEFPYTQAPKTLGARIDFVFPDVDPQTRRIRFRASLPNPDRTLRPETFVTLVLHGESVDRLVVPKEAVIDTGTRKYVLLALPDGYFDPRDVEVGPSVGDAYPVISGLAAGDRVVTSAQFLVDSETNLMSAMQNMAMSMPGMNMGEMKAPAAGPTPSGSSMLAMPGMNTPPMPSMTAPSTPGPIATAHEQRSPATKPSVAAPLSPPPVPAMPPMPGMDMPAAPANAPPMPPGHHHPGM